MTNTPWFKQPYFNQHSWFFENLEKLDLSAEEALLILFIQYFQSEKLDFDHNVLSLKTRLSVKKVDETLHQLMKKGYLSILMQERSIHYDLSTLYEPKSTYVVEDLKDLIQLYELEFKRPMSTFEVDKLKDWLNKFEPAFMVHALREAIIYRKLNFGYIDKILLTWLNKSVTLEDLNSGKKHG